VEEDGIVRRVSLQEVRGSVMEWGGVGWGGVSKVDLRMTDASPNAQTLVVDSAGSGHRREMASRAWCS
jgi:hypothetical protein